MSFELENPLAVKNKEINLFEKEAFQAKKTASKSEMANFQNIKLEMGHLAK